MHIRNFECMFGLWEVKYNGGISQFDNRTIAESS